jgi:hypothetical protein
LTAFLSFSYSGIVASFSAVFQSIALRSSSSDTVAKLVP